MKVLKIINMNRAKEEMIMDCAMSIIEKRGYNGYVLEDYTPHDTYFYGEYFKGEDMKLFLWNVETGHCTWSQPKGDDLVVLDRWVNI
jgi:hypothetical protein